MDKKCIFDLATKAASLSPAKRRKVGAIVMHDNTHEVIAEGCNHNNGKPCEDEQGNTYPEVVHAEIDAAQRAASKLVAPGKKPDWSDYTLYVTHQPCVDCEAELKAAGLKYEVVQEFLKFDGEKLRYDLIPTSTTKCLCFNPKLSSGDDLYQSLRHFELYRELYTIDKAAALDNLCEAFSSLSLFVQGGSASIPAVSLEGIATILTFGARKYKPNNWRNCTELERYDAAFMRHYFAFIAGEELDADSGYPHLWHALTNLAFLLELR